MSAEPLSSDERRRLTDNHLRRQSLAMWEDIDRYEATVQAERAGRLAAAAAQVDAEATLARVRNAIAALDGHTCHEGHTDADHLRLHRAVVAEVRAALEGTS